MVNKDHWYQVAAPKPPYKTVNMRGRYFQLNCNGLGRKHQEITKFMINIFLAAKETKLTAQISTAPFGSLYLRKIATVRQVVADKTQQSDFRILNEGEVHIIEHQ